MCGHEIWTRKVTTPIDPTELTDHSFPIIVPVSLADWVRTFHHCRCPATFDNIVSPNRKADLSLSERQHRLNCSEACEFSLTGFLQVPFYVISQVTHSVRL